MNASTSYSLDTSFLLYHRYRGDEKTEAILKQGVVNLVTSSELLYVLCRKEGVEKSLSYLKQVHSKAKLAPSEPVAPVAGQFKCKYPIALADCWVLATGKVSGIPALFAFPEKEIQARSELIGREVQIEFLEEVIGKI